jgi:hypothetical protein
MVHSAFEKGKGTRHIKQSTLIYFLRSSSSMDNEITTHIAFRVKAAHEFKRNGANKTFCDRIQSVMLSRLQGLSLTLEGLLIQHI